MHEVFLTDLAVVMIAAGLVTVLFHRLRQPVVLGYMIAGLLIGPKLFKHGLIQNQGSIQTLAELGVILLMFGIGLKFSLRKLFEVGPLAIASGALELMLMIWLGYQLGRLFGWGPADSLFLGAIVSIASTTIIAKTLGDLRLTDQ